MWKEGIGGRSACCSKGQEECVDDIKEFHGYLIDSLVVERDQVRMLLLQIYEGFYLFVCDVT